MSTRTAQDIVDSALRLLNVMPGGDSATGDQLNDSLQALTDLV